MNTEWFTRLFRIKQLSHAFLVYPGAVHTRYEHSLGTLYVADRMAVQLGLNDHEREVVRAAALLHDLGQGPFSHLFDEVFKWVDKECDHEHLTKLIIENDETIRSILKGENNNEENDIYSDVLEILTPRKRFYKNKLLADIISGGLDCDKLDYLRRDSYHAGVAYGIFDIERVLNTITKDPRGRLCILKKGKDAVENYRLGRYLMHIQVYRHHTREIADSMFLRAVKLSLYNEKLFEDGITLAEKLTPNKNSIKDFLSFYKQLDDYSIYSLLKNPASRSKELVENLERRKLLKRAVDLDLTSGGEVRDAIDRLTLANMTEEEMDGLSEKIAKRIQEPSEYVIVRRVEIPIKLFKEGEILVYDEDQNLTDDLYRISIIRVRTEATIRFYVFTRQEKRQEGYRAFKEITGVKIP